MRVLSGSMVALGATSIAKPSCVCMGAVARGQRRWEKSSVLQELTQALTAPSHSSLMTGSWQA